MSRISIIATFAALLGASLPVRSNAEENRPAERSEGMWETKSDLALTMLLFGYSPAKIVSDSSKDVRGDALDHKKGEFLFRFMAHGKYADIELLPYTIVPVSEGNGYHVNAAGIELNLLLIVTDRLRFGFYHHSSHNFSDGSYGRGIDLNAFVLDGEIARGAISSIAGGMYQLRGVAHYYFVDNASPYVITEDTDVSARRLGHMKTKAGLEIGMYDAADRRATCSTMLTTTRAALASVSSRCDLLFTPGPSFFGTLGDHMMVGPYLEFHENITRTERFGKNAYAGGVRIRFLFVKDSGDLRFR